MAVAITMFLIVTIFALLVVAAGVCRRFFINDFVAWKKYKHWREIKTVRDKAMSELGSLGTAIKYKQSIGAKKEEIIPLYERTFVLDEVLRNPEVFIGKDF